MQSFAYAILLLLPTAATLFINQGWFINIFIWSALQR